MVEYAMNPSGAARRFGAGSSAGGSVDLDLVFSSLADATRRAILARVLERPRTIGELAENHLKMSFAAISKHIAVLEKAKLIIKKRDGNFRVISANPVAITAATTALQTYQQMLDTQFNQLDELLKE